MSVEGVGGSGLLWGLAALALMIKSPTVGMGCVMSRMQGKTPDPRSNASHGASGSNVAGTANAILLSGYPCANNGCMVMLTDDCGDDDD